MTNRFFRIGDAVKSKYDDKIGIVVSLTDPVEPDGTNVYGWIEVYFIDSNELWISQGQEDYYLYQSYNKTDYWFDRTKPVISLL